MEELVTNKAFDLATLENTIPTTFESIKNKPHLQHLPSIRLSSRSNYSAASGVSNCTYRTANEFDFAMEDYPI